MAKGIDDAIMTYVKSSNKRTSMAKNLSNWIALKNKSFSVMDAMRCIFLEAEGSYDKVDDILERLLFERKTNGRTQVYNTTVHGGVDIIYDEKGSLKLTGLDKYKEVNLVGQHKADKDRRGFNQGGEKGKPRQKTEEIVKDLEQAVLELYPNEHPHYIYLAMQTIRNYAAQKKKSIDYVIKMLEKGRIVLDDDIWKIKPNVKNESRQRKVIVINESDFSKLINASEMTEQKFHSNIRRFISKLLQDPVNTQPSDLFKLYGLNRSTLLHHLLNGKNAILRKKERISDKDENGMPKTATMMVKYFCPKKDFDRKLQKLYIKLFEKNLPQRKSSKQEEDLNEEDVSGGATPADSNGQYVTGAFPMIRRKMPTEIEETTATTNTGNYQYTVPFGGDKETRARKNGFMGSTSINF